MKKLSVLIALALLVVAGTGYAVTCAQDNVPGATLLVPYFKVSGNGVTSGDIPAGGTDTLCAITNVSSANIIAHVTVWSKYSTSVLDFNVPLTGFDVAFWSMRDVLNGKLNVNPTVQNWAYWTSNSTGYKFDPCGQLYTTGGTYLGYYVNGGPSPFISPFLRFSAVDPINDQPKANGIYNVPAFNGTFRARVWSSLDESGDISDWYGGSSTYVIDNDNWVCYVDGTTTAYKYDFTGYVTIDVNNYCNLRVPEDWQYYAWDAIATAGWGVTPGPNILMGDIFFIDQTANTGNISGDPMLAIEFDSRLNWQYSNTFYGRYYDTRDTGVNLSNGASTYAFRGDGREPIGGTPGHYAFRYVQDNLGAGGSSSLRTWILVWRADWYANSTSLVSPNLCGWWQLNRYSSSSRTKTVHNGFMDSTHAIGITIYDNDETPVTSGGGPSGGGTTTPYILLETQRLVVTPNGSFVPSNFYGGWIDLTMGGFAIYQQSWVGVQHTGYGLAMSVGHSATLINNQFVCYPAPTTTYDARFPVGGATVQSGLANQTN